MNKKFFTLIASVFVLAGLVGTASAFGDGTATDKLKQGGKYQMAVTTKAGLNAAISGSSAAPFTISGTPSFTSVATPTNYVSYMTAQYQTTGTGVTAVSAAKKAQNDANSLLSVLSGGTFDVLNTFGTGAPLALTNPAKDIFPDDFPLLWYAWFDKEGYLRGEPNAWYSGKYYESIFCLSIKNAVAGKRATIDILNMAQQKSLVIDPSQAECFGNYNAHSASLANSLNVDDGYLGEWGYSGTYDAGVQHWRPLYTYVEGSNDSVYVFVLDMEAYIQDFETAAKTVSSVTSGTPLVLPADTADYKKVLDKMNLKSPVKIITLAATDLYTDNLPDGALLFEFVDPAPVVLTADDWNTKIGTEIKGAKKVTFSENTTAKQLKPTLGKDYAPWADYALEAVDVDLTKTSVGLPGGNITEYASVPTGAAYTTSIPGNATGNWLYFKKPNTNSFLRVDTTYYGNANSNLQFAFGDTLKAYAVPTTFTVSAGWLKNFGNTTNPKWAVDTTGIWEYKPKYSSDFINQYRFQATYFWSEDSLAIDVAEANMRPHTESKGFFEYTPRFWKAPEYEIGSSHADNEAANADYKDYVNNAVGNTPTDGDYLHVKLLDLIGGTNVLTIGDRTINADMGLNIAPCVDNASPNRTSVDEGVYIIKSANTSSTLYLNVPIYADTLLNPAASWSSAKPSVDPERIPAYQWVVKKVAQTSTSAITLYNREFPNVVLRNIKLYTNENTLDIAGDSINKSSFTAVKPALLKDQKLGYFYIDPKTADIARYDLQYYNQFLSDDKYFVYQSSGDSTIEVAKDNGLQFQFKPQSSNPKTYGYVPTTEEVKTLGIDTLKRVAYQLVARTYDKNNKPVDKILVINKEHRYALTDQAYVNAGAFVTTSQPFDAEKVAKFLFKTNNTVNGVDYYALLDTLSESTFFPSTQPQNGRTSDKDSTGRGKGLEYDIRYVKFGVPEDTKWIYEQVQREQRTSAFAVASFTPPLYRRFDGGTYKAYPNGKVDFQEEINKDVAGTKEANKPVWLKFTRVNNNGFEFLSENSPADLKNPYAKDHGQYRDSLSMYGKLNTSFLALHNSAQLPEKDKEMSYTFYVDTAYSERPAIGSLTSDFTPKPQYMLALRAQYYPADTLIHIINGDDYWVNSKGDTVIPPKNGAPDSALVINRAVTVGQYLYNAQDSVNRGKSDFLGKYGYGGEGKTRLAFVRGVHVGDTFYVIPNGTVGGTDYKAIKDAELPSKIDFLRANLPAELQHYLGANTHYEPRYTSTGSPASNGNGKAMVFQFRLINDVNSKDRRFIIETRTDGEQYGPQYGRWIRIENGVPFITGQVPFADIADDNNSADIFNVVPGDAPAAGEKGATANEAATLSDAATVISGVNQVNIINAAGKTVTVTNVLGQTVAKTVLASDNATIALPKGIVVVSVDGKSTKAVVK